MRRFEVTARGGNWSTVTLRFEAIDRVDAFMQAYREIGDPRVVWVDCRELP